MTPPLNAAIGIVRPSGSTSMRRPRGGRPLADREDDAALAQPFHGLDRALGEHLVLRDQRAVDVGQYRGDWVEPMMFLTLRSTD